VRENSVFWDERGLRGSIGFFNINIRTAIPLPIIGGGAVAFATPDDSAPRAASGTAFTLHDKPQKAWRKWLDQSLR
jgi:paraquat-inducible protein B